MIKVSKYRVGKSRNFRLDDYETYSELGLNETDYKSAFSKTIKSLSKEQFKLYAGCRNAVLIVLQGMDASGKDGLIRHVFSRLNSQGMEVSSFKTPSHGDLSHDFLWRHYLKLPAKGKIGVFNRSHYENVLITKVHPEMILNENIPGVEDISDIDQAFWNGRYRSIREFEKHLYRNGTIVLKFFLNLSKSAQSVRLLSRIEEKEKNWKFSKADIEERLYWQQYRDAFESAIKNTATKSSPWFIIPSDEKRYSRLLTARILLHELRKLKLSTPYPDEDQLSNLQQYKKILKNSDKS